MSRFDQEWALVPAAARWIAALVALGFTALMAGIFIVPLLATHEYKGLLFVTPLFLLSLIGALPMAIYVLLVGYVYGDARRRAMNHVLWTLLAVFIPSAVGLILYFILRDPVPVPCPGCGTPATKGQTYCARCGAAVRRACSGCHHPVDPGWRNCTCCGAALGATETPSAATSGAARS